MRSDTVTSGVLQTHQLLLIWFHLSSAWTVAGTYVLLRECGSSLASSPSAGFKHSSVSAAPVGEGISTWWVTSVGFKIQRADFMGGCPALSGSGSTLSAGASFSFCSAHLSHICVLLAARSHWVWGRLHRWIPLGPRTATMQINVKSHLFSSPHLSAPISAIFFFF